MTPCLQIKRCKTDSAPVLEWDNPERPEATNLLTLYQLSTAKTKVGKHHHPLLAVRTQLQHGGLWFQVEQRLMPEHSVGKYLGVTHKFKIGPRGNDSPFPWGPDAGDGGSDIGMHHSWLNRLR